MELLAFTLVALFVLGYGLLSSRAQRWFITPPMAFVLFGLVMGPAALGLIELDIKDEVIRIIAELTLVIVLFSDSTRIHLKVLLREYGIPLRLLAIGMPLTIIAGTLLARGLFPTLPLLACAALAAILAPTDAALGQAVVSNRAVPVRIRQSLNVESGLNDGIALPVVLFHLSLLGMGTAGASPGSGWALFIAGQLVLGPLVGIAVGYLGGRLINAASARSWMTPGFRKIATLAIALLSFSLAELVGGNGFISAFSAGLTMGNTARKVCSSMFEFAETEGQLLVLIIFLIFGAVMVVPASHLFTPKAAVYAVVSLTVVRMVPVALSLLGSRLLPGTYLFLGWFGPRGLASILFGLLLLDKADFPGKELVFSTVVLTVLLSVFAHGLTSGPLAVAYAAYTKARRHPESEEHVEVTEMPLRVPHGPPERR